MTASNHAITGALIAVTIKEPVLALPLAFVSHFVLDALPHFGYEGHKGFGYGLKHRIAFVMVFFDVLSWLLLLYILKEQAWLVYASALVAISPDFAWVYRFIVKEKWGALAPPPTNTFNRFHQNIQWCERPWGLLVELGWFGLLVTLLNTLA